MEAVLMPAIRGITTSVGYAPLLSIVLPRNLRHLVEAWVITSPDDHETQALVKSTPGARLHVTDAFTRHNARFNKGLAFEEGFSAMGRHGWMVIFDSDIVFPDELPVDGIQPTKLYGCHRRVLEDPSKWTPEFNWRSCPISRDGGVIGFFQLFNGADPVLRKKRPWYDVSFAHAGGGDAAFLNHWAPGDRVVLPFDVLHLGRTDCNWFGTDQEGRDMMARFVHENGWRAAMRKHSEEAVKRATEPVHRVEVPGYEPSTFELPFVRRAKQARGQG
jgi:hypothetical protein